MPITLKGDIDWVGAMTLVLEPLDGGPAPNPAGYAFTTDGVFRYAATAAEPLVGLYRASCAAGVFYATIATGATTVLMAGEAPSAGGLTAPQEATLNSVLSAVNALGASGLAAGSCTVTITVNDVDGDPLQNALVRLRLNGVTSYKVTGTGGAVAFAVAPGTYELTVSCSSFVSSVATLVAAGVTTARTVVLTSIGVSPSTDPLTTTGFAVLLDGQSVPEPGAVVKVQLTTEPTGSGFGFGKEEKQYTADDDGLVQVPGMAKGGTYKITRGGKKYAIEVEVPTSAGATWAITNFGGES